MRKKLAEKERFAEKFMSSNMTVAAFCKENGLAVSTFNKWLRNYKNKDLHEKPSQCEFLEIKSEGCDEKYHLDENEIIFKIDEVKIIFPSSTTAEFLGNLIKTVVAKDV